MTLTRRDFSGRLLGASLAGTLAGPARAQGSPAEGVHYGRLAEPVPVAVAGKVEVIEFFWYECPHCAAFEPALEGWVRRLPDDVAFRRIPVVFREEPFATQQRLFYALEALGQVPALHRKVFLAIHAERTRMRTPEDLTAFALKNGIDPLQFVAAFNSFSVQSKAQQARQIASAYKIDAVPSMGVQGRYFTNGNLANAGGAPGSNDRMLAVVDALVARVRGGGKG
jgi:thiol:disulfide interchange protein DsbA